MTKARRYQFASAASCILSAGAMMMRGTLPSGPTDFAGGFFAALGAAFLISAWVSADRTSAE